MPVCEGLRGVRGRVAEGAGAGASGWGGEGKVFVSRVCLQPLVSLVLKSGASETAATAEIVLNQVGGLGDRGDRGDSGVPMEESERKMAEEVPPEQCSQSLSRPLPARPRHAGLWPAGPLPCKQTPCIVSPGLLLQFNNYVFAKNIIVEK